MLLGILAQIEAACDCVAPKPAGSLLSLPSTRDTPAAARHKLSSVENLTTVPEGGDIAEAPDSESKLTTSDTQLSPEESQESRRETTGEGGGKAISREDVERVAEQRKKAKEAKKVKAKRDVQPVTITDHVKAGTPIKGTTSISPGKGQMFSAQVDDRDESARLAKKTKIAPVTKEKARGGSNDDDTNKKKKKKKKAKGDEFDDLFKGLF